MTQIEGSDGEGRREQARIERKNKILAEAVDGILIEGSDAEERREGANDKAKSPQQAERTC